MHLAQIVSVKLRGSAADTIPHSAYVRIEGWLAQWTPRRNFKTVLADNRMQAIERCRQQLRKQLVPDWAAHLGVKPEHFSFQVSDQEVVGGEFWGGSQIACLTDYHVGEL